MKNHQTIDRRSALKTGISACACLTSCAIISSSCTHLQEIKLNSEGMAILDFATFPQLQDTGGYVRVQIKGKPVSITRLSESEAVAVIAVCPHKGATLYDLKAMHFVCPRHGAKFKADGKVVKGPAKHDLAKYAAKIGKSGITLHEANESLKP